MTRFDVLCLLIIFMVVFGWPPALVSNGGMTGPAKTVIVLAVLIVLLMLGLIRY